MPVASSTDLRSARVDTDNGLTVSQVNQAIAHTLQREFSEALWVQAEIQGFDRDVAKASQRRWGQVYFELIEKEPGSDAVRASLKAVMWGDAFNALRRKLSEASRDLKLQDGLSVKFLCQVDFYWPRASLQLKVIDVDPHFTLGDMERARRELLERLKREGLLEKNRGVPFPLLPLSVGLITSEGSAAYHDFVHELATSGYAFQVSLVESHTQGPETERDVVRALDSLGRRPDVDVVVLIRGGGSRSDLIWFDKEKIARAIAECPKPVITGIGHEIDLSVADAVAHASRKTPTAVAQFLVEQVATVDRALQDLSRRLALTARERVDALQRDLSDALRSWREHAGTLTARAGADLREHQVRILSAVRGHLARAEERLRGAFPRLKKSSEDFLKHSLERLAAWERECALRDPRRLLEQGYALLHVGGKLIRSVRDVRTGDFIDARLSDGTFSANVLGVTPRPGAKGKSS